MDGYDGATYDEFKQAAGEFFRGTEDAGVDATESGQKILNLIWLQRRDDWTEMQVHSSTIVLELVEQRVSTKLQNYY